MKNATKFALYIVVAIGVLLSICSGCAKTETPVQTEQQTIQTHPDNHVEDALTPARKEKLNQALIIGSTENSGQSATKMYRAIILLDDDISELTKDDTLFLNNKVPQQMSEDKALSSPIIQQEVADIYSAQSASGKIYIIRGTINDTHFLAVYNTKLLNMEELLADSGLLDINNQLENPVLPTNLEDYVGTAALYYMQTDGKTDKIDELEQLMKKLS